MLKVRTLLTAVAVGAFTYAANMGTAEAHDQKGHNTCDHGCGGQPQPPQPPQPPQSPPIISQGGTGYGGTGYGGDAEAIARAQAEAKARADAAAIANGGVANANSGGNTFAPVTTYEGSAPATSAIVTTRCGWAFGGSVIGGGLSVGGNGDTCNQRQQAIEGLGNSTDVYERGMFAEQYMKLTPALEGFRDTAAATAQTCGENRRPVSSIFVGQAGMSQALCVPNSAQSGAGITNNINVAGGTGDRLATRTDDTCGVVRGRQYAAQQEITGLRGQTGKDAEMGVARQHAEDANAAARALSCPVVTYTYGG